MDEFSVVENSLSDGVDIELQQNQIRELMIWVHPGHTIVDEALLQSWKEVIEILQYEPRVALVETSMAGDVNSDPSDEWNSRIPYGDCVQRSSDHKKPYRDYLLRLGELEDLANKLLGQRYLFWRHGNFVDARSERQVGHLKSCFRLDEQPLFEGDPKKLFVEISCYGLLPDMCVEWQYWCFGLHNIAYNVNRHGVVPRNMFNLDVFLPNNYLEGKPSTQESLDLMIKRGKMKGVPAVVIDVLYENLPSVNDPSTKRLICDPMKNLRE